MAGSPKNKSKAKRASGNPKKGSAKRSTRRKPAEPKPRDYAREAIAEWRKAAKFGTAALLAGAGTSSKSESADKPPLRERLNPATTEKGGRIGDAADNVLSKLGFLGKAASKMSLGSRAVDKVVPDAITKLQPGGNGSDQAKGKASGDEGSGDQGSEEIDAPVPIQESIDLAVPIRAAYSLATRSEDYPQWSERIESVEDADERHLNVDAKIRGVTRRFEIEIVEEEPEWRLEWDATEGIVHTGVLTFHELAPSLTHLELSVDVEPENPVQRFTRTLHLPERAIRSELHRFKAYAELWQQVEELELPEEPEEDIEEEPEDEFEEEPEDEFEDEELEEEPEDDEDFDEEELDEEELDEEGEPAEMR